MMSGGPVGEGTGDADPAAASALGSIVARLSVTGREAPLVEDFARALLRRVPAAELAAADPIATARAVADGFAFVDARPPGAVAVRLTDPEVALDGGRPPGSVVEVSSDDRPFIVTTVSEELRRLGHRVVRGLHPVYGCERGPDGRLLAIFAARTAARRESFLQVEVGDHVAESERSAVVAALQSVLGDLFAATGDYEAMRGQVCRLAAGLRAGGAARHGAAEVGEAADLLEWLLDGNFVLSGTCRFPAGGGEAVDALGVLARAGAPLRLRPVEPAGPAVADPLRIVRTGQVSTVHRQVPMHCIDVAEPDAGEGPDGVFRLVGVFTAKANAEPAAVTPVLRYKLRRVLELEDVVERSQDEVALLSLFQVLPKDQLFETDVPTLRHLLVELLGAHDRNDVRVLVRVDAGDRTVSALVSVPTELYTPALRHRMEALLVARVGGGRVDADVALGDRPEAILRLVVYADGPVDGLAPTALEQDLRLLCRTWDEQLAAALELRIDAGKAHRLAEACADWFPIQYRDVVAPADAVDDVVHLDELLARPEEPGATGGRIVVVLGADPAGGPHARLKVFTAGMGVELSRFLPIIESLGLWVVEDRPYALGGADAPVHLHDFGVVAPAGVALDVDTDGPRLAAAALAMWEGRTEVDTLNRLVLRAGLGWDAVAVLRAYRRYRSQVGTTFSSAYVDQVLVDNAPVAGSLVELFAAMFDPVRAAEPDVVAELRQRVVDGCDSVARLDHDRILRGLLALVDATLRTNRYLGSAGAAPPGHLTLKFDSAAVPGMPHPVPHREIFVHGPSVEGVHLRWGPVARGGIRWSDRVDDYRTEVLDLMRAQVLKNAVIVPTGAKGGFVVKHPAYATGAPVDVAGAYAIFVASLLEVTDNVVADPVAGDRVDAIARRRDGDDPYLVVAADRGTATFSDLANRLSRERGFWLDDAFASGGSSGYDHKRLGITARGAWVAVRHHFAELGIDVQAEPFTVVGIGDMSGDVFGNAMLRSEHIRLVAAFDHRDIFVDPDPVPATSYRERARLAALPGSTWQDYDRSLISAGGGVWSRLDKRIPLSDQVREALRVDARELTAPELVRAVLQAPVALLFTGGIGTFVRASTEPDTEIDDRANADVRVEGTSIRARVVGEGANLAFTQRARIEYARRGGHVNTDAIDNAAGVDISDHEVNLKILLRPAVAAGTLTVAERDRLLGEACDDVVAAVLADCGRQSLALARAQALSPSQMLVTETLLEELEAGGVVDREVEALPTAGEMRARHEAGAGLTRPELAVVMAGAKRSLAGILLASDVPDQPALRTALVAYFPPMLAERFAGLLDGHRLRRELIASTVANELVNRMGATFVTRLAGETGAGPAAIAAAYWVARDVAGAPAYWDRLDAYLAGEADGGDGATGTPAVPAVVAAAGVVSELVEALTRDYLRRDEADDIAATVARDRPPLTDLAAAIGEVGTPYRRRLRARRAEALADAGLPPASADEWARLPELEIGPDAAAIARATGRAVGAVAEAMLALGEALGVDRVVERVRQASPAGRWGRAARHGLLDDLDELRRAAALRALQDRADQPEDDAVLGFLVQRARPVAGITRLLRDIEGEADVSLDALAVATRAVRQAIG